MDFALSEDQTALVDAVQSLVRDAVIPQSARLYYWYFSEDLQNRLTESGFLDAGRDIGPLEAALVAMEVARLPMLVEAAASAMVAPALLPGEHLAGPIALVNGLALHKAHRNLPIAKTAIVDMGNDVVVLSVRPEDVCPVASVLGYPYGRLTDTDVSRGRCLGAAAVPTLRQWWRASLAAEIAGAAQSAVTFTVDYVKERRVFGRPVGAYQAVQHRLAQCYQIARGIHLLALKAAWSGTAQDADLAACYTQHHVPKFMFDLHQFNGAMGVTNEHLLHLWLYRMRALQAEVGGAYAGSLDIADRVWGRPAAPGRREFT